MNYDPMLEEDEDQNELDGPAPVSSLAGAQSPREKVMQRIMQVRTSSKDEELPGADPESRAAAMEFAQGNALASGMGRAVNAIAAGTGYKPDDSAYDAIDKQPEIAMKDLDRSAKVRQAIESRRTREAQAAENRQYRNDALQARRDMADAIRGDKLDRVNEKKTKEELRLAVPGYERTGEVLPKEEEAQKFRQATAESEDLIGKLRQMRDLVKKYGSYEYGGEGGQEMESLATQIQMASKGPNMYALGVLTGPDLDLLKKITSDPSDLSSLFTRNSTRNTQIDTQLKSIEDKLATQAKSLGYKPAGQTKSPPPPKAKPGDIVKVKGKPMRVGADGDSLEPIDDIVGAVQ